MQREVAPAAATLHLDEQIHPVTEPGDRAAAEEESGSQKRPKTWRQSPA